MIYRISSGDGTVSITRLYRALKVIVNKHKILRTALDFDTTGVPIQTVMEMIDLSDDEKPFGFTILELENDVDENMNNIYDKIQSLDIFDLRKGRVLHCHIARHSFHPSSHNNHDLLIDGDLILLSLHHSVFDGASAPIFLRDLCNAYNFDSPIPTSDDTLQYIDYSVHEHVMDMTISQKFWSSQLDEYHLEHHLTLPIDRHRLLDSKRSGLASTIQIFLDDNLSRSLLAYASFKHLTLFQLGLATFYAFLFKLTNGENDLCIACINANRYRSELHDLIGMFVATLPYRIQLDPQNSFDQLVEQVRHQCLSILEHSHYPLQHILADSHHQHSSASFLETVFDFITLLPDMNRFILNETLLEPVSSYQVDNMAKFDFMLSLIYDPSATNNIMSCSLVCSRDIFDQTTMDILIDRYSWFFRQLFDPVTILSTSDHLYKLSIILPHELKLIHALNSNNDDRERKIKNTIGELFCQQAANHSQKMAVELDEQSLSYSELLYYVQKCAIDLLFKHDVKSGEIICQCVERSLTMVS